MLFRIDGKWAECILSIFCAGTEVRGCAVADFDTEFNQRHRIQPRSLPAEPDADQRRTSPNVWISRHSAWRCGEDQETAGSLPRTSCLETACRHGADL